MSHVYLLWKWESYEDPQLLSVHGSRASAMTAHKKHHPRAKHWPPQRCWHEIDEQVLVSVTEDE